MKRITFQVFVLSIFMGLTGCVLAPVLEGVGELGVTPGDRQRLLSESIRDYTDHMRWGDPARASLFMTPEIRGDFVRSMVSAGRGTRVVEGRVETVDFDPEARKADAVVVLRMYKEPFFIVQDQREKQEWSFIGNGEWQMSARTVTR